MPGGLWVDKHRPNTLDKLVVHKDVGANLRNLVRVLTARQPLRLALASCLALSACDELRRCALNAFCRQVADGDCPHVLFYGPSGAGKKTLVLALLREIYGPGVERIKVEAKQWKIDVGSRKVEVDLTLLSSNHHVEMNPSDVGIKDRYIVQEVIKEMARARPIGVDGAKGYKGKHAARCPAVATLSR